MKGMAEGRLYLRTEFLEHAVISDSNSDNIPEYTPLPGKLPAVSDPEYGEFVPGRYLFYEVAGNLFNVWRSPVYHDRYGDNARIDTLVQNDTADQTETAADGFLNWVRDQEYLREYTSVRSRRPFYDAVGETHAAAWIAFFTSNIGMFLRNAVIYNYPGGMVQFYKDEEIIDQAPIATGSVVLSRQLRLTPSEAQGANNTINRLSDTPGALPDPVEIFGWYPPPQPENVLSDGSPRWLLIGDTQNRLLWVASNAIDVGIIDVEIYPQANSDVLSPARSYSNSDLQTILGS